MKINITILLAVLTLNVIYTSVSYAGNCVTRTIVADTTKIRSIIKTNGTPLVYHTGKFSYAGSARRCGFRKKPRALIAAAKAAVEGLRELWLDDIRVNGVHNLGCLNLEPQVVIRELEAMAVTGLSVPARKRAPHEFFPPIVCS